MIVTATATATTTAATRTTSQEDSFHTSAAAAAARCRSSAPIDVEEQFYRVLLERRRRGNHTSPSSVPLHSQRRRLLPLRPRPFFTASFAGSSLSRSLPLLLAVTAALVLALSGPTPALALPRVAKRDLVEEWPAALMMEEEEERRLPMGPASWEDEDEDTR